MDDDLLPDYSADKWHTDDPFDSEQGGEDEDDL